MERESRRFTMKRHTIFSVATVLLLSAGLIMLGPALRAGEHNPAKDSEGCDGGVCPLKTSADAHQAGAAESEADSPATGDARPGRHDRMRMRPMAQKHSERIAAALEKIEAARGAVEAGNSDGALAALDEAEVLLTESHEELVAAARPPVVNARCPMMGSDIDPQNVTASLYRVHNGRGVGFCCGGCPAAWDKLTDEQKDEKLQAAMPE
jgi:hypothetical protein